MSNKNQNEVVVCKVQLYGETEAAIRVGEPGLKTNSAYAKDDLKWIPSSLISHSTLKEIGSIGEIEIPRWLAEKKELAHDEDE